LNLLIVIVGPTASGKTNLAVKLADRYKTEIISADSRQVYKGLDIGTGKDLHEYRLDGKIIKYHLIDVLSPQNKYSVFQFQKDFIDTYNNLIKSRKVPILCGGTGFYIKSILCNYTFSSIPPNFDIRNKLQNKTIAELRDILKQSYLDRIFSTDEIQTKRRIIRLIEIASLDKSLNTKDVNYATTHIDNYVVIGLNPLRDSVKKSIDERLMSRLDAGLIDEVESLLSIVSHERLFELGLEYRYISLYLKGEISYNKMIKQLKTAIHQFSKKQMTFFRYMEKNNIKIHWIKKNYFQSSINLVEDYLNESKNS